MAMENIVWHMITRFQQKELYNLYLDNLHRIPSQTSESLEHHKLLARIDKHPYRSLSDDGNHLVEWAIAQHLIGEPFYLGLYNPQDHKNFKPYSSLCKGLLVTTNPQMRRDALAKGYVTISKSTYESHLKFMHDGGKLAITI